MEDDDVKDGTGRRLLHTREFSRGGNWQTETRLLSGIRDEGGKEDIVEKKRGKEREGRFEEEEQPRAKLKRY